LPASIPIPITITQHMPKLFVQSLASRLNKESKLTVLVAEDGMALKPGHVYIAPGEIHMEVVRKGVGLATRLVDGPKLHHCKPAVDRTFYALAKLAPVVKTLAVVLTGMGVDGADGAKKIGETKGYVIAQDEASSAVWGMPGATVKVGAANDVLPLNDIAGALAQIVGERKSVTGGTSHAGL
jgi:two-component system chemotaxis response regulator CheB